MTAALILSILFLSSCNNEKIKVDIYTSIYPLEFVVKNIVKDEYVVRSVYPRGRMSIPMRFP